MGETPAQKGQLTLENARIAARKGYDFLDKRKPGWDRHVTNVVLPCPRRCPMGLAFGNYETKRRELEHEGIYPEHLEAMGFYVPNPVDYTQLETAWHELLDERRAKRYGNVTKTSAQPELELA
jgi:hypothetical protein